MKRAKDLNQRLVRFLAADTPNHVGRQAIELDVDVLESLNAYYKAMDGKKAKRRIVNEILRAAFKSDSLNDAFAFDESV